MKRISAAILASLIAVVALVASLLLSPMRLIRFVFHEGVKMKGRVQWHFIDASGSRFGPDGLAYGGGVIENLVVTAGKNLMASLWSGTGTAPTHLAIGSGSTAEAVGQTALVTETARVALDTRTSAGNVTTAVGTIPAGTGTGSVQEIGLFNAAAAGTMTQRALTGAITKPAGLGLQFTWTTTFN